MKKKIFSKHLLSYFLDGAFSFGLIALSILECLVLRKTIGVETYENLPMGSYAVTITLIPCVVTIVSAILGLSKDKIYGVTIADIGELRGPWYFVHLHKMLVVCVLLGIHSLLFGFGLKICLYYLEFASFVYAVFFSIQEISVFVHSRWVVRSILRKRYLYDAENDYLFRNTASKTFKTMSQNLVVTEGIELTYDVLKGSNDDPALIEYLMTMQNQYFRDVLDSSPKIPSLQANSYYDVSIVDAIDCGYNNISVLLYESLKGKVTPDKYYKIKRLLFFLHRLCALFGLEEKEKEKTISLISTSVLSFKPTFAAFNPDTKPTTDIAVIVCMLAMTLDSGETWFVKYLRDNKWALSFVFSFENNSIGVFTSMMIFNLLSKNALTAEEKGTIEAFLKEPEDGMNSNGFTWRTAMQLSLECTDAQYVIRSISSLMTFYESVPEENFAFHGKRNRPIYDGTESFTKSDLIHDWLLLTFASLSYGYFSEDIFDEVVTSLSEENQEILLEELSENWLLDGALRKDLDCSFLTFYEGENASETSADWTTEPLVKKLVAFHDDYYEKLHNKKWAGTLEKGVEQARKTIIESFDKAVEKYKYFTPELKVDDKSKVHLVTIRLRGDNWQKLLEGYLDYLPEYIRAIADFGIRNQADRPKDDDYKPSDKIKEKIQAFAPNFTSCRFLQYNKEELENLRVEYVPGVSRSALFWKKDAICFNAKIDDNEPLIRRLTSEEIEGIIQKEYTEFENGLYRYSDMAGDKKHSYYVTKEKLVKLLGESILIVEIMCRYAVSVKPGSVLFVDQKVDW